MQGYGNDQVHRGEIRQMAQPQRGQQWGESGRSVILPLVDNVGQLLIVQPGRDNPLERRRRLQAGSANTQRGVTGQWRQGDGAASTANVIGLQPPLTVTAQGNGLTALQAAQDAIVRE